MAHRTILRWKFPLFAMLFLNTVLVAMAFRQCLLADQSPANSPLKPVVSATTEPQPAAQAAEIEAVTPAPRSIDVVSHPIQLERIAIDVTAAEDANWEELAAMTNAASARTNEPSVPRSAPVPPVVSAQVVPEVGPRLPSPADQTLPLELANASDLPPAADHEPPAAARSKPVDVAKECLIVINPPATGGAVHFLAEGSVVSLAPGELYRLPGRSDRRIQFHRGDDRGDFDGRFATGVFAFAVGADGWTLDEVAGPTASRLLRICRPVASDPSTSAPPADSD
jgi:hypothetical protein